MSDDSELLEVTFADKTVTRDDIQRLRNESVDPNFVDFNPLAFFTFERCTFESGFDFSLLQRFDLSLTLIEMTPSNLIALLTAVLNGGGLIELKMDACAFTDSDWQSIPQAAWQSAAQRLDVFALRNHLGVTFLPDAFGHLSRLRELTLTGNDFRIVPPCVRSLVNLETLDVSDNNNLTNNDVNGADRQIRLRNLRTFKAERCDFTHLPAFLSNSPLLQYLMMSQNRSLSILNREHNDVFQWPALMQVDFSGCQLARVPEFLRASLELSSISFNDNDNVRDLPSWFSSLKKLELVDFSFTNVRTIPSTWADMPELRILLLARTQITTVPAFIANWSNLETLNLQLCDLTSTPPIFFLDQNRFSFSYSQVNRAIANLLAVDDQLREYAQMVRAASPRIMLDVTVYRRAVEMRRQRYRQAIVKTYRNALTIWRTTSNTNLNSLDVGGTMHEVMKRTQ